ncbi:MAG: zinc finger domain-containing protein [Proteobacteria bacterium]|nr:zinc finger domain-containing protein [Pseudomonadota bacterium]
MNAKTPNQDEKRCFNCNEFGHWVKDCPQKQNNSQQGNNNAAQQKSFPGANFNYMYPMVPQVPMAPVAMPSNSMQVPMAGMQGNNQAAALGQMQDVMMQMKDVGLQDNPLYMELTEVEKKEDNIYLN